MSDTDDAQQADDELLALLGEAIEDTNAVPPWLTRFANESHRLISLEGELAAIVSDSLVDAGEMRSGAGVRTIEFAVDGTTVRLEVDGAEIRGSVSPAPSEVHLVTETDTHSIQVNQRGFFQFDTPAGLFRIVAVVDGSVIRTDWVRFS